MKKKQYRLILEVIYKYLQANGLGYTQYLRPFHILHISAYDFVFLVQNTVFGQLIATKR